MLIRQVTNSIDQTERIAACDGALETVDVAPIIAESIRRTHNGLVISLRIVRQAC
jgi:ribose-phosphate pyrophosphokinase